MEVTLKQFAQVYNTKLNRRGKRMCEGYLYRLIRQHKANTNTRELWFNYTFVGDKDSIRITVHP
jgi:hypothetical protein